MRGEEDNMTAWCYPTLLVIVFRSGAVVTGWFPWAVFWRKWGRNDWSWWSADDEEQHE